MKKITRIKITILIFVCVAKTWAQIPSYVPTNGLVSWYPFSGNANDFSGNGNNATVNGAILSSDRFGNSNAAYSFNGSSAYLIGDASTFPANYRTISLWFYSGNIDVGSSGMQVFGYGGGVCGQSYNMQMDNPDPMALFTEDTYELSVGCNLWNTALPFAISTPSPNNNWHHWVITISPSGSDFYIDGNYNGGVTTPIGGTGVSGKKFFIGACPDSIGLSPLQNSFMTKWNGKLDDIGIWDRALSQQEISDLYNATTVGLNSISLNNSFSIFPNPTLDELNINFQKEMIGKIYSIEDILGNTKWEGKLIEENVKVDFSNFPPGIYLLKIDHTTKRIFKVAK